MQRNGGRLVRFLAIVGKRSSSSTSRLHRGTKNYYSVLKITPNATQEEIKKAYYKLSKIYHPDTNESDLAHEHFTAINEAYNILGNLNDRKIYDRGLSVGRGRGTSPNSGTQAPEFHGKKIVYDFDDWTQKYYTEAMRRRKRHAANRRQFEMRHVMNETEVFNRRMIVAAVFTLIGVVVMINSRKHYL